MTAIELKYELLRDIESISDESILVYSNLKVYHP